MKKHDEFAEQYLVLGVEIALGRREGLGQDIIDRLQAERDEYATHLRRHGWTLERGS